MALKALMLRHQISRLQEERSKIPDRTDEFAKREADLETAINEAGTREEEAVVAESVAAFEQERDTHNAEITRIDGEIAKLTRELEELEAQQPAPPPAALTTDPNHPTTAPPVERKDDNTMPNNRGRYFGLTRDAFGEFVKRDSQREWLQRVRELGLEGRSVSNVGLTIPRDVLGLIRDNLPLYSKLLKHVDFRSLKGESRTNVLGVVPEGIWTEMVGVLNGLNLIFASVETDGYMVGGFIPINNSYLKDSDENLAMEIITALTKAIAKGVDKAIGYGKGTKMPMGIVTRLVMTTAPENYKNSLPFKNISGTNVIALGNKTGTALFKALLEASGHISTEYGNGEIFWVMNRKTHTKLLAESLGVNANGTIVAGMNKTMPIVGGDIETCDWMPDDVIIGGGDGLYLLVEREGATLDLSKHAQFVQNNTLYKGLARYDGIPVIAEGFVAISLGADKPTAAAVTFAADNANAGS